MFAIGVGLPKDNVKRKTFVAREDLLNRLSEVAQKRGYSLYYLVNEVFDLALEVDELGLDLRRVVEERGVFEAARKAGFILGLESLWYDMADWVYFKSKDEAVKIWFEAGVWFAKRYVAGSIADSFEVFKKDLVKFTWNVYDFTMEKRYGKVYVRLSSPRFSEAFTILFKAFICGALDVFGFKVVYEEVGRGLIRLEAVGKDML